MLPDYQFLAFQHSCLLIYLGPAVIARAFFDRDAADINETDVSFTATTITHIEVNHGEREKA